MHPIFTDTTTLQAPLRSHRASAATYTPFVGVPSVEPPREVEGFIALLHQDDGSCQVPPSWMSLEILLS